MGDGPGLIGPTFDDDGDYTGSFGGGPAGNPGDILPGGNRGDFDNDGVPNSSDVFPNNPHRFSRRDGADTDGDGIPDNEERDADGDGYPDDAVDEDGDGIPDHVDDIDDRTGESFPDPDALPDPDADPDAEPDAPDAGDSGDGAPLPPPPPAADDGLGNVPRAWVRINMTEGPQFGDLPDLERRIDRRDRTQPDVLQFFFRLVASTQTLFWDPDFGEYRPRTPSAGPLSYRPGRLFYGLDEFLTSQDDYVTTHRGPIGLGNPVHGGASTGITESRQFHFWTATVVAWGPVFADDDSDGTHDNPDDLDEDAIEEATGGGSGGGSGGGGLPGGSGGGGDGNDGDDGGLPTEPGEEAELPELVDRVDLPLSGFPCIDRQVEIIARHAFLRSTIGLAGVSRQGNIFNGLAIAVPTPGGAFEELRFRDGPGGQFQPSWDGLQRLSNVVFGGLYWATVVVGVLQMFRSW